MTFVVEHFAETQKIDAHGVFEPERAAIVRDELERILKSPFFRNAIRSRQFLQFVVHQTIDGHSDRLKERNIGIEVFQRPAGYETGVDPVVRVQAGDVRKRLEQYHQALIEPPPVRIELPLGSYVPQIQWPVSNREEDVNSKGLLRVRSIWKTARGRWTIALIGFVAVSGLAIVFAGLSAKTKQRSVMDRFWEPAFATPQPVLICLAKPVVYRPTLELYEKYAHDYPGTFQSEVERSNQEIPFKPDQHLFWGEMSTYPDYGVAVGDVYAAVKISAMLGQIRKPSQVRIGTNYSFTDLRNSPSVIVGAFNNKWTMQITQGLHFAFVEDKGNYTIREQNPGGRIWHSHLSSDQQSGDEYAIVARLLDSKTGQFTIIAAGITGSGTETAGEFVSNQTFLERGIRGAASDWQKKNLELVLKTTVVDAMAGPPQVQAAFAW